MSKEYLVLGVVLVLLAGCSGLQPVKLGCNFPDAPQTSAPSWVCGATIGGVAVSAVGSAAHAGVGYDALKDTAASQARVRLAGRMQSYVRAMVKKYAKTTGTASADTINKIDASLGKQINQATLTGSRIFRTAISPKRTLYVLVGMEPALATQHAKDILRASMQNNPGLWKEFSAEVGQRVRVADIVGGQ